MYKKRTILVEGNNFAIIKHQAQVCSQAEKSHPNREEQPLSEGMIDPARGSEVSFLVRAKCHKAPFTVPVCDESTIKANVEDISTST